MHTLQYFVLNKLIGPKHKKYSVMTVDTVGLLFYPRTVKQRKHWLRSVTKKCTNDSNLNTSV